MTYRARIALDGPLVRAESGTEISIPRASRIGDPPLPQGHRRNGRIKPTQPRRPNRQAAMGPPSHNLKRDLDPDTNS